jgi:hypothetical protein
LNRESDIITWLMHGSAVMRTKFDLTCESDYKLDIIISEGPGKYNVKRPAKIDPKRLVLLLLILIVLIYTASLTIQPSFKLNIHNQCLNVDLVSPTYTASNRVECHRPPDYKVYAGDMMKSRFIIKLDNELGGALIYKIQRRLSYESTEISENASSPVHLLVVWKISASKELRVDVLLVKHDNGFVWSTNNLKNLYRENIHRLRLYSVPIIETWLLNDNTALKTAFEIVNEDYVLDVTISEVEKHNCARKPEHIDPKR